LKPRVGERPPVSDDADDRWLAYGPREVAADRASASLWRRLRGNLVKLTIETAVMAAALAPPAVVFALAAPWLTVTVRPTPTSIVPYWGGLSLWAATYVRCWLDTPA